MDEMDRKFKDPESRNKLKNLKIESQKQIERNKTIMKDFINRYKFRLNKDHSCESLRAAHIHKKTPVNLLKAGRSITRSWARESAKKIGKNRVDRERQAKTLTTNNLDKAWRNLSLRTQTWTWTSRLSARC